MSLESVVIFYNTHFADDPLYNHATHVASKAEDAPAMIEEVIRFFAQRRLNPCFYVSPLTSPKGFSDLLAEKGFTHYDQMIILELAEEPFQPEDSPIKIIDVDDEMVNVWAQTFIQAFNIPDIWVQEVFRRSGIVASHKETKLLLGYFNEKPVGTIALYSKNQVGGIYCLGTLRTHRGKGVASALLRKAILKSKKRGDEILCLQTLGQDRLRAFYGSHGFKTAFTRSIYLKPQTS